jgi:aspartate kinase
MKFGGTSLADPDSRLRLVEHVRSRLAECDVVLVVSAMGRAGSPYATDTLLELVDDCEDPRECDKVAACGEIISTAVIATALQRAGIPARSLSGAEAGILTDDRHGRAQIVGVEPDAVRAALAEGLVPVIAGFQGLGPDGMLTTLGRGGSDTTACALGAALNASCVEVYTDVEGVMTADPATLPAARVLETVEYQELFQMARHGSRVMHAPAAESAMDAGIPVRIRSTFSDGPGTLVTDAGSVGRTAPRRIATAVSHVDHVARFVVTLPADDDSGDHMDAQTRLYETMADADVSLDMFTPVGKTLVFSTAEGDVPRAMSALDSLPLPYEVETGLAKVTLIGAGMHGIPGVMARMSAALRDADVTVKQTADSHATISVLVWQNMRYRAVEALHGAFGLDAGADSEHPAPASRQTGERPT